MRTRMGMLMAMMVAVALPEEGARAQSGPSALYTAEELDNLLAPVALYPDPILAQVLVAASYPDQVEEAARYVGRYGNSRVDEQDWDISVRAVAHYAPVLNLMADRPEWTVALGQAYAEQPADVMDAVQSLRSMARAHGNLVSTAHHRVYEEDRHVYIVPAHPQVVYVPVYDPYVVYHRPIVHLGIYRDGWSFGMAFPIGVWLTYDTDWRYRRVYYHGWRHDNGRHRGWYDRSRPHIVVNNIYVYRQPVIVVVNRTVIHRRVDYDRFDRYNYVHRRVAWDRDRGDRDGRRYGSGPSWDRGRRDRDDDDRRERGDDGDRGDRGDADRGTRARTPARTPSWDRSGRTGGDRTDVARAERRSVPRSDPRSAPREDRSAAPQGERRSAPQVERRSEPVSERRSAPQFERRSQPRAERPSQPQSERRSQPQVERRSQPQVERGSAPQMERRTQPRGETRSQPRSEQRSQPRSEQRSAPRSEVRGNARGGGSGEARVAKGRSAEKRDRGQ